jgi:hypothetical protein
MAVVSMGIMPRNRVDVDTTFLGQIRSKIYFAAARTQAAEKRFSTESEYP